MGICNKHTRRDKSQRYRYPADKYNCFFYLNSNEKLLSITHPTRSDTKYVQKPNLLNFFSFFLNDLSLDDGRHINGQFFYFLQLKAIILSALNVTYQVEGNTKNSKSTQRIYR